MSGIRLLNDQNYTVVVDKYSTTITYVGSSLPGSSDSKAVWKIMRVYIDGTVTRLQYADGNMNFDNVWANRLALTYE